MQNGVSDFNLFSYPPRSVSASLLIFFIAAKSYLAGDPYGPQGYVTAPYATMVAATTHTIILYGLLSLNTKLADPSHTKVSRITLTNANPEGRL